MILKKTNGTKKKGDLVEHITALKDHGANAKINNNLDFDKVLDRLVNGLMFKIEELNKKQGLNPGSEGDIHSGRLEIQQKVKKGMSDFLSEIVEVAEP